MPRISEFYRIVIYMYHGDHPLPHFHAWYGGDKAKFLIATGQIVSGYFLRAQLGLFESGHRCIAQSSKRTGNVQSARSPFYA